MVAAALEMATGPDVPINHLVQEAFLVHVRNLAQFFLLGVAEFKKDPLNLVGRTNDNIYADDFCHSVKWSETPFGKGTKLIRAIGS